MTFIPAANLLTYRVRGQKHSCVRICGAWNPEETNDKAVFCIGQAHSMLEHPAVAKGWAADLIMSEKVCLGWCSRSRAAGQTQLVQKAQL